MNHQRNNSKPSHYSGITYHGTTFTTHFHNSYELICVLNGSIKVTVNTTAASLGERDFLLIPPCVTHSITESENAAYFIAIITPDYIPDFFETHKKNESYLFSMKNDSFAYLETYFFRENAVADYHLKACLYIILSYAENGKNLLPADRTGYDFVLTVNSYIADHFQEPIKRAQLAKITGYEEHYFSSLFKHNFGLTLCQYINLHRISYALNLLCTTDKSIGQIALECGFSSVKAFNNVFLLQMGEPPSQYRKSNNQKR